MRYIIIVAAIFAMTAFVANAQSAQEATRLHQAGKEFLNEGKIAQGRESTRQAMEMRRKLFGEVNEDFINSLNNYALSFSMEGNHAKAIELQEHLMELCEKMKYPHPNLGLYTLNMGRFYYLNGNMSAAAEYCERALPFTEKFSETYEVLLLILGSAYEEMNDSDGIHRVFVLSEEHNRHELSKDCNDPECMLERALYYMSVENNAMAKECFMNTLSMPMDNDMKIAVYESYSRFLYTVNDYTSAADYLVVASKIRKEADNGKETDIYANMIYRAAIYAFLGKEYSKAIDCYRIAADYYLEHSSPDCKNLMECYIGIGNAYSALKDYPKSKEFYQKVVSYYESNASDSKEYPKVILKVAKIEKFNHEYEDSITHHLQAMKLFEIYGMTEEYADAANSLKLCYAYAGKDVDMEINEDVSDASMRSKLDDIIRDEEKYLELTEKFFSKLSLARSLSTIAGCYLLKEDYFNAISYYKLYVPALRDGIRDEFRMLSDDERMQVWNEEVAYNIGTLESLLMSLPSDLDSLHNELAAIIYDVELLSKGVLLKSSIFNIQLFNHL